MSPESPSIQATQSGLEEVEHNVIAVIPSPPPDNNPSDCLPADSTSSAQTSTLGDKPQSTDPSPSPSTRNSSRSPPPGTINMTGLRTALPDIALNSPSTNIIGTPFAYTTTNTPFEYPFPDTASSDSAHSPPPSHPSYRPGSPQASLHYPYPSFQPPPPADTPPFFGPIGPLNLVHPKYKAPPPASPPPMPPSLKKKRWSLNLLSRRRTSNPPTPGEGPTPPPGSPPSATSGAIIGGLGSGRPSRSSSGGIKAPDA